VAPGCQIHLGDAHRVKKLLRSLNAPEITQTSAPGQEENHKKCSADDSAAITTPAKRHEAVGASPQSV